MFMLIQLSNFLRCYSTRSSLLPSTALRDPWMSQNENISGDVLFKYSYRILNIHEYEYLWIVDIMFLVGVVDNKFLLLCYNFVV